MDSLKIKMSRTHLPNFFLELSLHQELLVPVLLYKLDLFLLEGGFKGGEELVEAATEVERVLSF